MPPTAARRHRSRSSVDSLLELVHGLDDHDVHRLLADLNNTSEGNVAVAKALDIFQKPSSPKFEFGPRHVSNPSPTLLVARSRRLAAENNRGYNNNNHYTHLRLHHATTSPASKTQTAPADGCGPNFGATFGKRISSAPLLDRERALPPRQSPTTCETVAESQTTNISVPSRGRPPSTPPNIHSPRTETRSPGSPLRASQTPCLFAPAAPPPPVQAPALSPPPPPRASSQGRRAYKRISRPKFHLPFSAAANNTTQTSLHVPTLAFPGDGSRDQDEDEEHGKQPDLRALLLAAYTLGDGCNLPVPQSPQSSPLRGPRSMVNLRSLRQQQEQDDEFWFDGRRPTTPDNMLLEPLPRFGVAVPTARMDPWRMDSLSAILNEA
ncbi:uncharacterized protein PpBr36_09973 [Pyricularia pennisetigena]|uniref:uncharacterized protein n=1 Tax=Pyricularia pennisetigena TaxID=1578925 RepID=UPI00114EC0A4|nr:uncharacterized protein PpBr36_09973 [Pyricularia pennisetigena]TLS22215.1 hypothetical protein PpBr36_09973 [Pyricularia pennisetigena]